jgi:hypothetical protein
MFVKMEEIIFSQLPMNSEISFFAKTNHRNKETVFGIKTDDRRRHMYVIGKTGMGKTNLIQNMAIQDIRAGRGVAVIDPHGEFAEQCLKAVPSRRINDVLYFNPADTEFPVAFNIMDVPHYASKDLAASGIIGVFHKLWATSWGPRLENTLRHAVLSLLAYPNSTLLEVLQILVDEKFREKVIAAEKDPVLKSFWDKQFRQYSKTFRAEVVEPVQNKISQFLTNSLVRNIIGQPRSKFDVRDFMDSQKILIVNLSKGRIGEDNSALLGGMMIAKMQLAAMARADSPESQRPDFYLFIDEFHNFATKYFASILAEVRKYRLNLILAHQYINQLITDNDTTIRDAVFGTVSTLISFRVGAEDAEFLEKHFAPVFRATDLVNLDKHTIYLQLMIDGLTTPPFSAITLAPEDIRDTEKNAAKIIKVSQERYAKPRRLVESHIKAKFSF